MGKASRRKKEKRAQAASGNTKKTETPKKDSANSKKAKKALKKVLKKVMPQKKQQKNRTQKKGTKKVIKKITIEALDKKAASVELALSSAVKKVKEMVADKEQKTASGHFDTIRQFAGKSLGNIKEGMDPDKLDAFKKELTFILKKGGRYTIGIIAVVAILVVIELHSNGRTFPGLTVAGVEIGYLPYEKAREKLSTEINTYMQQPVIFSFEGDSFEVSKEELGIQISPEQTLEGLPVYAFQKENPLQFTVSLFNTKEIAASHMYDENKIIHILEEKLFLKDKRARNARFVPQDGNIQIEPEKSGFAINKQNLVANLNTNLDTLKTNTVEIEIRNEEPIITAAQLETEKDHLISLLNKPITLTSEKASLNFRLIDHLYAVSFQPIVYESGDSQINLAHANPVEGGGNVQIHVDENGLSEFLQENLIKKIEKPVSPGKIYRNEEGHVVIEGKGEDGRSVPRDQLLAAINMAANNGTETVPVPVVVEKAPLDISEDLRALGIEDLLATGHSAYYGSSSGRIFNIEYGASKYNGVLIAPGEEFSFNEILGPVDGANGFKIAKVIKKNKLELEYGGGICQVSTTLYRAVLQAGLQITERRPHSWKVSYYSQSMGDGLDATIYPGVVDLKFINNTQGHLLIQSYTEGSEAYFKIYGTDDGRTTVLDGPYGGGLTYRWNRTVLDKDGNPMYTKAEAGGVEEIWSQYKPIPVDPPPQTTPAPPPSASAGGVQEGF